MIWFMLSKMMLKIKQISYWWDLYSGDFTHFTHKNKKIVTDFSYHNSSSLMEHMTGIEPAYPAWEASVLPLNYMCVLSSNITAIY